MEITNFQLFLKRLTSSYVIIAVTILKLSYKLLIGSYS